MEAIRRVMLVLAVIGIFLAPLGGPYAPTGFAFCLGIISLAAALKCALCECPEKVVASQPVFVYGALFCVAGVSFVLSLPARPSVFGSGMELGSLSSFALLVAAVAIGAWIGRRRVLALSVLLPAGSIYAITAAIFGAPAGTLPAFIAAAVLLGSAVLFDGNPRRYSLALFSAALAGSALLLRPVPEVLWTLAVPTMFLTIIRIWDLARKQGPVPLAMFAVIAIVVVGTFSHSARSPSEHRAALYDSYATAGAALMTSGTRALFGFGPGESSSVWNSFRADDLGTGLPWDVELPTFYNSFVQIAVELGVLGASILLLVPLLLVAEVRAVSGRMRDDPPVGAAWSLALFFSLAPFLHPLPVGVFIITAGSFGLWSGPSVTLYILPWRGVAARIVCAVLFCVVGCTLSYVGMRQGVAAWYHARGMAAMDAQDYAAAADLLRRADDIWYSAPYARAASLAYARAGVALLEGPAPLFQAERIRTVFDRAVQYAEQAVGAGGFDYDSTRYQATLYVNLVGVGYPGASERAKSSIAALMRSTPNNPAPHLLAALLSERIGDRSGAEKEAERALDIRPGYTPAIDFLERLQAAGNSVENR